MSQTATVGANASDLQAELSRLYAESGDPEVFGRSLLSFLDELGRKVKDKGEATSIIERLAEQLDRAACATLAAGAMHDLRSLVQVLVAQIDHARTGVLGMAASTSDPERARDVLRTLDDLRLVAVTMANITRDGVAMQRAAGGGSVVDLQELLQNTLRMHRRVAKGRLVLEDPPRVEVKVSRGALMRVLSNLLSNALDVVDDAPVGRVTITAWVATDDVFVQVADNGPGIPEELQHKIFDMFFTTKDKGSGVGLPVCRRLIGEWGGTLQMQSKPGEGTRFTFGIPKA